MSRATSGTSATASGRGRAFAAFAASAVIAAVMSGAPARADDAAVEACASASEKGQVLRDQGKLRAARELFVACGGEACPAVVQKDCAEWLAAVDAKLPSVVVRARDEAGRDLAEVRVTVDGEALAERLDGRALAVDPGSHTFRVSSKGTIEVTQTLLVSEGDKGRVVDVVLRAPKVEQRPAEVRATVPAASWALGAVGLAGFGVLAGFGAAAKSSVDEMRATCAPGCAPERVDAARRDMILANVGLGAGVAALGAAVVVAVLHNRSPASGAAGITLRIGAAGAELSGAW